MLKTLKRKLATWLIGVDPDDVKRHDTQMQQYNAYAAGTLGDTYLFDFTNWAGETARLGGGNVLFTGGNPNTIEPNDSTEPGQIVRLPTPTKIKVKPIDVLNELETVPTPFTLALVEEKIAILKDKEKLINQLYAKREVTALIERLTNRQKYMEHKEFFDKYPNTTDEKIDALLSKYELVMKTSDIFVPEFPDEAIAVMKDYTEKLEAICGKKPIFYVIAEAKDFKKAYEKRDPILLVQSPFGFYWQILGAWDKEMLLLSEL